MIKNGNCSIKRWVEKDWNIDESLKVVTIAFKDEKILLKV